MVYLLFLTGKCLENANVLHVHSNNDLIKTSKIENHIRENIRTEVESNADHSNAFNCNQMLNLVNEFNYFEQERLFVIFFKCVFSLKKEHARLF